MRPKTWKLVFLFVKDFFVVTALTYACSNRWQVARNRTLPSVPRSFQGRGNGFLTAFRLHFGDIGVKDLRKNKMSEQLRRPKPSPLGRVARSAGRG